jgi:hypothetical protein
MGITFPIGEAKIVGGIATILHGFEGTVEYIVECLNMGRPRKCLGKILIVLGADFIGLN